MRVLRTLVNVGAVLAAISLAYICIATVSGVVLRYVFREPNRFLFESTEFALALAVFLSFGFVAWRNGNVRVDLIPGRFSRFRGAADVFSSALVAIVASSLAWFTAQILVRDLDTGVRMGSTFGLPRWVLMAGLLIGLILIAITEVLRGIQLARGKEFAGDAEAASEDEGDPQ